MPPTQAEHLPVQHENVPESPQNSSRQSKSYDPMSISNLVHEKDIPIFPGPKVANVLHLHTETTIDKSTTSDHIRRSRSEKKREWRKNLTPHQRDHCRQVDAERKRQKRKNLTEQQRIENRKKDAHRKAQKRTIQKVRRVANVAKQPNTDLVKNSELGRLQTCVP